MHRITFELRNLGVTPADRALNAVATMAFQLNEFLDLVDEGRQLDSIEVERDPICRTGSDCWDIVLKFFNPEAVQTEAFQVFRFSVDVSDVIPVAAGRMKTWKVAR